VPIDFIQQSEMFNPGPGDHIEFEGTVYKCKRPNCAASLRTQYTT